MSALLPEALSSVVSTAGVWKEMNQPRWHYLLRETETVAWTYLNVDWQSIHVYNQCKNHEIAEVTVMLDHRRWLVFVFGVCVYLCSFSVFLSHSAQLFYLHVQSANLIPFCPSTAAMPFHLWHFHPRGVLTQAHMVTRMEVSLSTRRRVRLICRDCSLTGGVLQGHTIKFIRAVTFSEAAVLCSYTPKTSALSVG